MRDGAGRNRLDERRGRRRPDVAGLAECAHEGGEVASNVAVNTLGKILNFFGNVQEKKIPQIIHKALQEANDDIIEMRKRYVELSNMGTTVVLAIFFNELVYYSHLGDSRAYLYNNKGMA